MKTILIVETSLDALRATKDRLVQELSDAGNLKKWGDDSVETNKDVIYFLKVISLTDYLGKLNAILGKGYDELQIDSVIDEAKKLLYVLENYPNSKSEPAVNTEPEAQNEPESDDEEEDDLDTEDTRDEVPEVENDEKEEDEEEEETD